MPDGLHKDAAFDYRSPDRLELNQWTPAGNWTDAAQAAVLNALPVRIVYRFHARDLHLVLGSATGRPVRFRVRVDGKAPGENRGLDTDVQGNGKILEHRLYQLIRQRGKVDDRTFEIEFLDAGAEAFAFTFG